MPQADDTGVHYRTLSAVLDHTDRMKSVRKSDLQLGDQVLVTTRNSTYSINVLQDDLYVVSGGWFDKNGLSPSTLTINGCTWGGRAIKWDIIAACGLHLEFGNQVVTSRIKEFQVIHCREDIVN